MTDEVGRQIGGRESKAHNSARREGVNVDRISRRSKGKGVGGSTTKGEAQHEPQDEREPELELSTWTNTKWTFNKKWSLNTK
ncbi:hypothetical protein A2U01_0076883, partial [Trifolium medium]|nr:hypothetical protein [Trifolium medium]